MLSPWGMAARTLPFLFNKFSATGIEHPGATGAFKARERVFPFPIQGLDKLRLTDSKPALTVLPAFLSPAESGAKKAGSLVDWYLKEGYLKAKEIRVSEENVPVASFGVIKEGGTLSSLKVTGIGKSVFRSVFGGAIAGALTAVSSIGVPVAFFGFAVASDRHAKADSYAKAGGIISKEAVDITGMRPTFEPTQAFPTDNSTETELWREKLIRAAEHNIVISGNYCGGTDFNKLLDVIEERMGEKPNLKVVILSDPIFLTPSNNVKLQELQTKYGKNFSLVCSKTRFVGHENVKQTNNHTKCTVIDYGKYFILGGSGIKNNFTGTGLDHLSKKQYLEQKSGKAARPSNPGKEESEEISPVDLLVPGSWRDMDFVFCSLADNKSGKQVYKQSLLLALKHRECDQYEKKAPVERFEADKLGAFTGIQVPLNESDDAIAILLKSPIPDSAEIATHVPDFHTNDKKSAATALKLICLEPNMDENPLSREIAAAISRAKKSCSVNHMYFHPNDEVRQALVDAANRGVKIEVITNGSVAKTTFTTHGYRCRSTEEFLKLKNGTKKECRENLEFFEFYQPKSALHKKAIVIDDETVIAGSSNLGSKSLNWSSDDEINFIAVDKVFAKQVKDNFECDKLHSRKARKLEKLSFSQRLFARYHRSLAWIWG